METVIITGASNGIGLACARKFAANKYAVCGVDLESSSEIKKVIADSGGSFHQADVLIFGRAFEIAHEVRKKFGKISALVTCAGISIDGKFSDIKEEDFDKVISVDLKGTFNYMRAVSDIMTSQKSGKIVTIASTLAIRARRGVASYVSSKAGVIGLTRAAARDLGRHNINVNAVAPGLVLTRLTKSIPDETKSRLLEETCIGRLAEPEDVANVAYFLCTEEARHITGEVVRVDGGQLA